MIDAAWRHGTRKLVFLGSSCIYPKLATQPMKEEALLSGLLEPTNEPYAIAKIAGIKMAEAYRAQYGFDAISLMPTNLYGPGDNFDLQSSHVFPALIRKFHEASITNATVTVMWAAELLSVSLCMWTIWPGLLFFSCGITAHPKSSTSVPVRKFP